jgi:hypothetical protein
MESSASPRSIWLLRATQALHQRMDTSQWLVIGVWLASAATLIGAILLGIGYEYQQFQAAWSQLIPGVHGIALMFFLCLLLAAFIWIDTLPGVLPSLLIIATYAVLQLKLVVSTDPGAPALYYSLVLAWHVIGIPLGFLFSIAMIGQLTGSALHAVIALRHQAGQARQLAVHLAAQRAIECEQLAAKEHQARAQLAADRKHAERQLQLQQQAHQVGYLRAQAKITTEQHEASMLLKRANTLLLSDDAQQGA